MMKNAAGENLGYLGEGEGKGKAKKKTHTRTLEDEAGPIWDFGRRRQRENCSKEHCAIKSSEFEPPPTARWLVEKDRNHPARVLK